jgi:hypothetical protein
VVLPSQVVSRFSESQGCRLSACPSLEMVKTGLLTPKELESAGLRGALMTTRLLAEPHGTQIAGALRC